MQGVTFSFSLCLVEIEPSKWIHPGSCDVRIVYIESMGGIDHHIRLGAKDEGVMKVKSEKWWF